MEINIRVRMGIGILIRMRMVMKIGRLNDIGVCIRTRVRLLIANMMKIELKILEWKFR